MTRGAVGAETRNEQLKGSYLSDRRFLFYLLHGGEAGLPEGATAYLADHEKRELWISWSKIPYFGYAEYQKYAYDSLFGRQGRQDKPLKRGDEGAFGEPPTRVVA